MSDTQKASWQCPNCHSKQPRGDNTNTSSPTTASSNVMTRKATKVAGESPIINEALREWATGICSQLNEIRSEVVSFKDSMSFFNEQFEQLKAESTLRYDDIITNLTTKSSNVNNTALHSYENCLTISSLTVCEYEVERALMGLDGSKTSGLDGLPPIILKKCAKKYVDPFIDHCYIQKIKHMEHSYSQSMDSSFQSNLNILEGIQMPMIPSTSETVEMMEVDTQQILREGPIGQPLFSTPKKTGSSRLLQKISYLTPNCRR
ncbi:unnamed protein product [Parnassius apollo]|uniref:(apollo) hypothetical protein n=1 Tax=Parnassius apollo TaxID=110799 RepID=A0A8S3WD33_PARAO|nr:unnamed protein product [Parnassius apollo]